MKPSGIVGVCGETASEINTAGLTVRPVLPVTVLYAAEMVAFPTPGVEARPVVGLIVTAAVFEEDQVGLPVVGGSVRVSLKAGETRALSLVTS